jgi:hypothetical protein
MLKANIEDEDEDEKDSQPTTTTADLTPIHECNDSESRQTTEEEQQQTSSIRVTFLVNVWKDRKPANVQPLEDSIRQELLLLPACGDLLEELNHPLEMVEQSIPKVTLTKEEDLPKALRHRIEVPFVTKGITWEEMLKGGTKDEDDDDDDDEGGLVVVTFPPPPTDDTVLVTFGPGLQAYLDNPEKEPTEGVFSQEAEHESGYV